MQPLLEPQTAAAVSAVIARPPHALLLTGPAGIGKETVARWIAASLLQTTTDKLTDSPQLTIIEPVDGKAISIEAVRTIEHFLALRSVGKQNINRIVLITAADTLTHEAQNALLKTLEEPPQGTILILTSAHPQALLATIRSRLQSLAVHAPAHAEVAALLSLPGPKAAQVMALSGGLPGLAIALAADDADHPLVAAAQQARELLKGSSFERVAAIDRLSKSKQASQDVIYMLQQMSHAALLTGRSPQRWQKVLRAAYDAEAASADGVQAKLVLTELMLNL